MGYETWLDGRIKLYNGDCLEFMDSMQEQVDLVLTDPPYLYLDHKLDKNFDEQKCFELFYKIMVKNSILAFFGRVDLPPYLVSKLIADLSVASLTKNILI